MNCFRSKQKTGVLIIIFFVVMIYKHRLECSYNSSDFPLPVDLSFQQNGSHESYGSLPAQHG